MKEIIGFTIFGSGLGLLLGIAQTQKDIWWLNILIFLLIAWGIDMAISAKIDDAKKELRDEMQDNK